MKKRLDKLAFKINFAVKNNKTRRIMEKNGILDFTPDFVESLETNEVFVFGSNLNGACWWCFADGTKKLWC